MDVELRHDRGARRFEVEGLAPDDAHLDYRVLDPGTLEYHHTWVAPRLRGRGIAQGLVRAALEHARDEGLRVVPRCSFVRAYVARHPELSPE